MKESLLLLLIIFALVPSFSQKHDAVWLTGYDEFPGMPGYGHAIINFLDTNVTVQSAPLAFNFESTAAFMSNKEGHLLFYTNGCDVANRNHVIMPNGDHLNPGSLSDQVCPWKGYTIPQGAMALPMPGDSSKYCLLHMSGNYDPTRKLVLTRLQYSIIDMSQDGGLGDLSSKNNILVMGDLGSFTAIRHGNGRDWWVIVPDFGDQKWHTILLTPHGFEINPPQPVSILFHECEHHGATAAALDGSRVANWGDCKVVVLDFDRCSGTFSNPLQLLVPSHWVQGGGVVFSPSGRYLYATSQTVLFRADLESTSPKLDTMRYSLDPYYQSPYAVPGNTFYQMVNGPNGNIFIDIPSRANYLHVLKQADGATIANIKFLPKGLSLPVTGVRTLPIIPNYRLLNLPNSPCDTLGITATHNISDNIATVQISPNPGSKIFEVTLPSGNYRSLAIFNIYGIQIGMWSIEDTTTYRLDIGDVAAGLYWVLLYDKNGLVSARNKITVIH